MKKVFITLFFLLIILNINIVFAAEYNPKSFVSSWKTTIENQIITLPLNGNVNVLIDWGDGSELEIVTEELPKHKYIEKNL